MKPWEHPEVKEALSKLVKIKEEKRTLRTPSGPKLFTITIYRDSEGRRYIELKTEDGENYMITPVEKLREMLEDIEEHLEE